MGADFIVSVLEFNKPHTSNEEPDFKNAREYLEVLTNEQLMLIGKALDDASVAEYNSPDLTRGDLVAALNEIEDAWTGYHRRYAKIPLTSSTILVTGDHSWGDPVPESDTMEIFYISGLAHAAGFEAEGPDWDRLRGIFGA